MHRQAINRGRVAYEPNSLAGGCPFQAGAAGFTSFAQPVEPQAHKVRGKAERFADHYTQATLFWNSQTAVEQSHIINAFRFELSRVQTPAIRERMVAGLLNVDDRLAETVAAGLGMRDMPSALPKVLQQEVTPEVTASAALSLFARPGDGSIRARRVAILVGDGVDGDPLRRLAEELQSRGAVPRFVGQRLGIATSSAGQALTIDVTMEAAPSVLFDAVVVPSGDLDGLAADGRTLEFLKDQYRHCKPMLVIGNGTVLLDKAGIPGTLPSGESDPGLVIGDGVDETIGPAFMAALGSHRSFARETDPPRV
jgi:catalase